MIAIQAVVTTAGAVVASFVDTPFFGISVFWGGMTALANMVWLAWRMIYGDQPTFSAHQHLRLMYRSGVERFFVVTVLLAIGMLKLRLIPLAVLLGFLVGQLILMVVPIIRGIKVK